MAWRVKSFFVFMCIISVGLVLLQSRISFPSRVINSGKTFFQKIPPTNKTKSPAVDVFPKVHATNQMSRPGLSREHVHFVVPWQPTENHVVRNTGNRSNSTTDVNMRSFSESLEDHRRRIETLERNCQEQQAKKRTVKRGSMSDFYYSTTYHFAYCKVPKSGSTFWMKLFMVLKHGDKSADYISKYSRAEIHLRTRKLRISPSRIAHGHTPLVVVSRNPYSRLHSAYVDKIFLPLFWDHCATMEGVQRLAPYRSNSTEFILKKTKAILSPRLLKYKDHLLKRGLIEAQNVSRQIKPICANEVSFESFLKFIISEVDNGKVLEPHWAPISNLCRPCLFNTHSIVKQESFYDDLKYVLNSFGIDITKHKFLEDSLSDNSRAKSSVPGIVGVVADKVNQMNVNMCITPKEITFRLWKAFQIQGFIRDDVDPPAELVNERAKFINAALNAIANYPMAIQSRREQRHKHLVHAYSHISRETIEQIQRIYHYDFILFDYSIKPPV